MSTIYLARHGHVENPKNIFYGPEPALSELGRVQIREAAQRLAVSTPRPRVILSSPWLRAVQTAEIYAAELGIECVQTDERLIDWQAGSWIGRPLEEFYAATGYDDDPPNLNFSSDMEPLDVAAKRVMQAIRAWAMQIHGQTMLVVGHREPLVAAMLQWEHRPFTDIHHVDFPVAAVWKMELDDRGAGRVQGALRANEESL